MHLQPVVWKDDWPVIGNDEDGDGTGEPVLAYRKPNEGKTHPIVAPQTSDEFDGEGLGLQWQWHANYRQSWFSLSENKGKLRLFSQNPPDSARSLWQTPNLLLQKLPAPEFAATTKISFHGNSNNEKSGLIVMGEDYAFLALNRAAKGLELQLCRCLNAREGGREEVEQAIAVDGHVFYLRVTVEAGGVCRFSFSHNGEDFESIGKPFQARAGRWIGAKVGLFALKSDSSQESGYADFDFFQIN